MPLWHGSAMVPNVNARSLALAALLLALPVAVRAATPVVPVLPIADVRPGQRAVVRTVFAGDSVETFEAEILGVMAGGRADGEVILARATSPRAVASGIAAGDLLVTDGADKLRGGARVEVTTPGAGVRSAGAPGAPAAAGAGKGADAMAGGDREERQKRWAEFNARIERGEFGEEIKKLPEAERRQKMRELREQGGAKAAGTPPAGAPAASEGERGGKATP